MKKVTSKPFSFKLIWLKLSFQLICYMLTNKILFVCLDWLKLWVCVHHATPLDTRHISTSCNSPRCSGHRSPLLPLYSTMSALRNASKMNRFGVDTSFIFFNSWDSHFSMFNDELPWFTSRLDLTLGLSSWNVSHPASFKLYALCLKATHCSMECPGTPPW